MIQSVDALAGAAVPPLTVLATADFIPVAVAAVAGIPALLAVFLSHRVAGKKIEQVHVLVNSRLTEALDEIASLKITLDRKDAVIADQTRSKD